MDKKVNEKKKRYAIIISFLVLMICITGGTYAYFALTASNNSVTGTVGGASLNLTVTKVYPTSEHNSKNMIPQLEGTLDDAISTSHKCIDGNGNVICQVYSATVKNQGSTSSVLNGTISFTGIDNMPNLKWMRINDSNTLGTYSSYQATTDKALFEENKSFGANGSQTYYFVFWIDETGEIQTDNGTFRANIEFGADGGLTSTVRPSNPLLSDYIISLYNDGSSTTNATVGDGPQTVSLNETQKLMKVNQGDTYGEEYRYYGATPNNYVEFNNELWRIISVSKVFSSESDTTGETRVRIIRDETIGYHAWDYNQRNNWETSTLMTTLNNTYYNKIKGACYTGEMYGSLNALECDYSDIGLIKGLNNEAKSLINSAVWYLGAGSFWGATDVSDGVYHAYDYYTFERGTTVSTEGYPYRWIGNIGIMYPSDYAYATDLDVCKEWGSNCVDNDWLYIEGEWQWLISPDVVGGAFLVYDSGYIDNRASLGGDGYVQHLYGVRPVVVLKPNVLITEGTGISGAPYKLALS